MNDTLSFMSANYVARTLDYNLTGGWGKGDEATRAHFKPIGTFPERFSVLVEGVTALGFEAIDLRTGHLSPEWTTDAHIATARSLLDEHRLSVPSLAGGFGETPKAFERSCKLAAALSVSAIGGATSLLETNRPFVVETLKRYGLKLGLENHPERIPAEMPAKISDTGNGHIGTASDTGWYATHGFDAAEAIEALGEHVFHIHLKDVREFGAHETCRLDTGVVPIEGCLEALLRISYDGPIAVEHESETFNPTDDVRVSLALVHSWMDRRG